MKNLNKALISSAVLAALAAGNAFAGTEACFSVGVGTPAAANFTAGKYTLADCKVVDGTAATAGFIVASPGSVAYERTKKGTDFAALDLGQFDTPSANDNQGLHIVYVPTSDIPQAALLTFELENGKFGVKNNNQIFLLGIDPNDSTKVRQLGSSDGTVNNQGKANFITQAGNTIPAGTRLLLSSVTTTDLSEVRPIYITLENEKCAAPDSNADVKIRATVAKTDNGRDIEGGVTTKAWTVMEVRTQYRSFVRVAGDKVEKLIPTEGNVDSLFYGYEDAGTNNLQNRQAFNDPVQVRSRFVDHSVSYENRFLSPSSPEQGVSIAGRGTLQRAADLVVKADFIKRDFDIDMPNITNEDRLNVRFNSSGTVGSEKIGAFTDFTASESSVALPNAVLTSTHRPYFPTGSQINLGGSPSKAFGDFGTTYPLRGTSVFGEPGEDTSVYFTVSQTDTRKPMGFNYSVDVSYNLTFGDNRFINHCADEVVTHHVGVNGAILKAPYVVDGPGNFVRVTNEDTKPAHVIADLFSESVDGTEGNREVTGVYLGTIPAKSSVVYMVPDIAKAAVEQKGYTGAAGAGFATGALGANAQTAANRHTVTLTVTNEQNKVHGVTVQKIPGGVDRVMPVFKPSRELVYGPNGEQKVTFSWQQ